MKASRKRPNRLKSRVSGEATDSGRAGRDSELDELHVLMTTGRLTPEQQTPPVMGCIRCSEPMTLLWMHATVAQEDLANPQKARWLPGAVWGKDIAPICPCCSFEGCPHQHGRLMGDMSAIRKGDTVLDEFGTRWIVNRCHKNGVTLGDPRHSPNDPHDRDSRLALSRQLHEIEPGLWGLVKGIE